MNHEFAPVVEEQTKFEEQTKLNQVHSGMRVYDSQGKLIGKATFVYLGSNTQNELERGEGAARDLPLNEPGDNSFVEMLAGAFSIEEMPTEMVERLRRHGFMRIDRNGLFASDRFATAKQIALVTEDDVHLNVTDGQLATAQ